MKTESCADTVCSRIIFLQCFANCKLEALFCLMLCCAIAGPGVEFMTITPSAGAIFMVTSGAFILCIPALHAWSWTGTSSISIEAGQLRISAPWRGPTAASAGCFREPSKWWVGRGVARRGLRILWGGLLGARVIRDDTGKFAIVSIEAILKMRKRGVLFLRQACV